MKERIVINKGPIEEIQFKNLEKVIDGEKCVKLDLYVAKKQIKTEQVPETFEELKELVNKYSGKINRQVCGITVGTTRIIIMMKFDNIYFGKNGNIYFADKFLGTYTPARQWQIIKSLIGE